MKESSLIDRMAVRFSMDAKGFWNTVRSTAFLQFNGVEYRSPRDSEVMQLLSVADTYGLNPFNREIWAIPTPLGIRPVVSVDGWIQMVNSHEQFDGVEFTYSPENIKVGPPKECPRFITATIHRKDRKNPISITEYLDECYRKTTQWNNMTKRMLRHKAFIQCARVAFGFSGIEDQDDVANIIANFPDTPKHQPSPVSETKENHQVILDDTVDQYLSRVKQCGWEALISLAEERFTGSDRQYVLTSLAAARGEEKQPDPEHVNQAESINLDSEEDTELSESSDSSELVTDDVDFKQVIALEHLPQSQPADSNTRQPSTGFF